MMIAAASLLFPTHVIFTRRRQRTRRRRRRRRSSSSSSSPVGRRSHQHLVGLVDVLIGLRDADDASHGGCKQRERPTKRKMSLGLGKSVFFFFVMMLDVGTIFFCLVFFVPFREEPFKVWGKEGVHTLKGQGAHFLNCFLARPHTFFSFFITNHLTKRSEKNTPRRTRNEETRI